MSQPIQSIKIRDFTGISTKINATDTPPGTLFRADGVNTVPAKAISFGPNWQTAWGMSDLGSAITTALAGADTTKTHFVTVAFSTTKFLVAWDLANNRPQGIWHVAGTSNPFVGGDRITSDGGYRVTSDGGQRIVESM